MPLEIERKFLTKNQNWQTQAQETIPLHQGYLSTNKARTVRVRVAGNKAYLTIKGKSVGAVRPEYEYEIPVTEALEMMALCEQPVIAKTRYLVPHAGHTWEVDVFSGANEGLIVAEVELSEATEDVVLPDWVGEEVTGDARYFNSSLILHPFSAW